jgi:hypothetical protein
MVDLVVWIFSWNLNRSHETLWIQGGLMNGEETGDINKKLFPHLVSAHEIPHR